MEMQEYQDLAIGNHVKHLLAKGDQNCNKIFSPAFLNLSRTFGKKQRPRIVPLWKKEKLEN